jgi:hypothetical protein
MRSCGWFVHCSLNDKMLTLKDPNEQTARWNNVQIKMTLVFRLKMRCVMCWDLDRFSVKVQQVNRWPNEITFAMQSETDFGQYLQLKLVRNEQTETGNAPLIDSRSNCTKRSCLFDVLVKLQANLCCQYGLTCQNSNEYSACENA